MIGSRALVNTLPISHSAVFLTGVAMIIATSVDRVVQMRKERGGEENETEKILSEIVWTAVPPDDRREQKGRALVKEKGKERNIN